MSPCAFYEVVRTQKERLEKSFGTSIFSEIEDCYKMRRSEANRSGQISENAFAERGFQKIDKLWKPYGMRMSPLSSLWCLSHNFFLEHHL